MAKRFLITGCASGIGQALAKRLLADGAQVCATDVQEGPLAELMQSADESRCMTLHLDVRDAGQWSDVYDRTEMQFGGVDVLINVAGVIQPAYVDELTNDQIDLQIDVNAKGVMLGTTLAAKRMLAQEQGHIVNIASLAGISAIPGLGVYTASKFAVRGFTLAVASELRPRGINVTVVCPDAVQTPMLESEVDYPQAALAFSGNHVLSVDEVVDCVVDTVLKKAPLEVTIPKGRGLLARMAGLAPGLSQLFVERLTQKGKARQASLKKQ